MEFLGQISHLDSIVILTGAGISADRVELNNSTVSDNLASANGSSAFGGGVSGAGGTFQSLKLTNSTVSSNTASASGADAFGGGIQGGTYNSTVIINSIVAGNTVAPGNQGPDAPSDPPRP